MEKHYVIAVRYRYYGPRTGQWTLHTVDTDGVPMRGGMVAQYATREDARRVANEMHHRSLPHGAGDRETRVMRADSRMARRLMSP